MLLTFRSSSHQPVYRLNDDITASVRSSNEGNESAQSDISGSPRIGFAVSQHLGSCFNLRIEVQLALKPIVSDATNSYSAPSQNRDFRKWIGLPSLKVVVKHLP